MFANLEGYELIQALETNCLKHEETTITKMLSEEELEDLRRDHTEKILEHDEHEEVLENAKILYKAASKPLKKAIGIIRQMLKHKSVVEKTTLYAFDYQEEGIMAFYTPDGKLFSSRRLYPYERQTNLNSEMRKIS